MRGGGRGRGLGGFWICWYFEWWGVAFALGRGFSRWDLDGGGWIIRSAYVCT